MTNKIIIINTFFLIFMLVGSIEKTVADIFSSMVDVETLVSTERQVLDILHTFQKKEQEKLALAKRYLQKFNDDYNEKGASVASHPVKAFQFLKHMTTDWQNLHNTLNRTNNQDATDAIRKLRATRNFPDEEDLTGTAEAFNRLQVTYKIHPRSIANGQVRGTRPTIPFTARDAFIIGKKQAESNIFDSAAIWLEIALEIFMNETDKTTNHAELLDWLQYSIFKHSGNVVRVLEISKLIKQIDPLYGNVDQNLKNYQASVNNLTDQQRLEMEQSKILLPGIDYDDGLHYEALCRGEGKIDATVEKHLICYRETYNNPYLLIQPVKMELVYIDPDVYVIHDAILDSQIERIKKVGKQFLFRARVIDAGSIEGQLSKARVSKIAFLTDDADRAVAEVNRYSGHATNLNATLAEQLQINNYGIGGHYLPHWDFLRDPAGQGHHLIEANAGDRIATFLMYMTDVEAGGATVFTELNLTLFPQKNAAAFWYNLHADGVGDKATLHSGCPVLSGTKWVSNKWFRVVGQDKARPCSLHKDSPDTEDYENFSLSTE